jgi:hypothetical protein
MSDEADVDPAELEAQLDHIKEAMGLRERYEGITAQWLLFGVLVAVAAGVSQVVYLRELPGYYHGVVWIGLLFGGGLVGFRVLFDAEDGPAFSSEGKPNLWLLFGASYAAIFPIQIIVANYLPDLDYQAETLFTLSLILVLIGLAYVLMGNALRAYYIRARDRYAFYVGGVLLAGLGTAMPYVELLREWGYAVFGAVYLAYAVVTYVVLTRT